MKITNNGYTVKTEIVDGQHVILVKDLIMLDGHAFTEFYKKLLTKYILQKYKRQLKKERGTALTLEGCVKICEMFRQPNDELINKIKGLIVEHEQIEKPKKIDAEQLVDIEIERQRQNKVKEDILKADNLAKIDMILQRVKSTEVMVGQINSHFQDCVDKIDNRLLDVENSLSYINDKPNQQETSFRTLLKECIKEIIREELLK